MAVFGDSIWLDIAYFAAIVGGLGLCCVSMYFCVTRVVAKSRRKHIKAAQPVSVIIVKDEYDPLKDAGPPRPLTKRELERKRQRDRERAATAQSEGGRPQAGLDIENQANEQHHRPKPRGGGIFGFRLFGCASRHPPINPDASKEYSAEMEAEAETEEGPLGTNEEGWGLTDPEAGSNEENAAAASPHPPNEKGKEKKEKKEKHKKHHKGGDIEEGKVDPSLDTALGAAAAGSNSSSSSSSGGGGGGVGGDSLLTSTEQEPEPEAKAPVKHVSAAAEKAKEQAKRKAQRRDERQKAEASAISAEQARLEKAAHDAMLAAESAEQKEARRLEKEARLEREKLEKEAEAERKRLSHIQDGLAMAYSKRREGAMLANAFAAGVIEDLPGNSGALSLFDIDPRVKTRTVVDSRLDVRFKTKQETILSGQEDSVLANAGPSESILPPGWVADPVMPWPLTYESVNHRRCMVVFNEPKATGWFPGTVSGVSKRQGFNYSVKFEKSETANIEIDGIKSVAFRQEGENAYGRGWVLLLRDPNYRPPPGQSRPSTQGLSRPPSNGDHL